MVKNAIIALLEAVIISSADCCAYCWPGMLVGMWTVFFLATVGIENVYDRIHACLFKRRRLQKQVMELAKK